MNQEDLAELSANTWKLAAQGKLPDLGVNYNMFGESEPTSFTYPLDMMVEKMDHLLIRIFNYERSSDVFGLDKKDITKVASFTDEFNKPESQKRLEKNAKYIFLPIPQQISDAISVSYAEDTLNPLQTTGLNIGASAIDDPLGTAQKGIDALKSGLSGGLTVDSSSIQMLKTALAGKAINQLGANVNPMALITRASGQVLQSNLELLFSGVTLRSFPFVYDFVARDPREGEVIKGIIRTLKKAMTAKNGRNGLFLNSPDVFQLEYKTGNQMHPFLNSFKVCALSDLSVNYTGSGTYATYGDGTPVHIQVQMTFKEINPVYSEDYDVLSEGGYKNVGY